MRHLIDRMTFARTLPRRRWIVRDISETGAAITSEHLALLALLAHGRSPQYGQFFWRNSVGVRSQPHERHGSIVSRVSGTSISATFASSRQSRQTFASPGRSQIWQFIRPSPFSRCVLANSRVRAGPDRIDFQRRTSRTGRNTVSMGDEGQPLRGDARTGPTAFVRADDHREGRSRLALHLDPRWWLQFAHFFVRILAARTGRTHPRNRRNACARTDDAQCPDGAAVVAPFDVAIRHEPCAVVATFRTHIFDSLAPHRQDAAYLAIGWPAARHARCRSGWPIHVCRCWRRSLRSVSRSLSLSRIC